MQSFEKEFREPAFAVSVLSMNARRQLRITPLTEKEAGMTTTNRCVISLEIVNETFTCLFHSVPIHCVDSILPVRI